jgi:hypothetical protein
LRQRGDEADEDEGDPDEIEHGEGFRREERASV